MADLQGVSLAEVVRQSLDIALPKMGKNTRRRQQRAARRQPDGKADAPEQAQRDMFYRDGSREHG